MDLYPALCFGRFRLFTGCRPSDAVGKIVLPHRNCPVSKEIMIYRAAAVLFLCSEKQLSLLSQMQNMRSIFERGVNIVGDHDDCNTSGFIDVGDLGIQTSGRDRVKSRHRFIQKDQFLGSAHGACQQHPLLLTSGQIPVALVLQIQDLQCLHVFPCSFFFRTGIERPKAHPVKTAGKDDFPHTGRKILLDLGLLGQVADFCRFQPLSHLHFAGGGFFQTQKSLDQGTLPCSVLADDAKIIALLHGEVQITYHRDAVIGKGQIFTF